MVRQQRIQASFGQYDEAFSCCLSIKKWVPYQYQYFQFIQKRAVGAILQQVREVTGLCRKLRAICEWLSGIHNYGGMMTHKNTKYKNTQKNQLLLGKLGQGNFKYKFKWTKNGLKCELCEDEMSQNQFLTWHDMTCPERMEIRQDLDLDNLDDFKGGWHYLRKSLYI